MSLRLFYIDDSGAESARLVVFGWVELDVADWQPALRRWLDWRKKLHATTGIAASYELHGTKFANGRGRPTGTAWDNHKAHRSAVMVDALTTIATLPGIHTGAVAHRAQPRVKYYRAKTAQFSGCYGQSQSRWPGCGGDDVDAQRR